MDREAVERRLHRLFGVVEMKFIYTFIVQMAAVVPLLSADLRIEFKDNSDNELGFVVERSRESGPWGEIVKLPVNQTSYVDAGLEESSLYYYRIAAYNQKGKSGYVYGVGVTSGPDDGDGTVILLPAAPGQLEISYLDILNKEWVAELDDNDQVKAYEKGKSK